MIKIFAGIGMAFVALIMAIFLQYATEKIKKWRKTGCKVKMLCNPHIYDFSSLWPGDGKLTLKCKKCGKVKKLYVDVESLKGAFDKV